MANMVTKQDLESIILVYLPDAKIVDVSDRINAERRAMNAAIEPLPPAFPDVLAFNVVHRDRSVDIQCQISQMDRNYPLKYWQGSIGETLMRGGLFDGVYDCFPLG